MSDVEVHERKQPKPIKLFDVLGYTETGDVITVADRIIERVRLGDYPGPAARGCGIDHEILIRLRTNGARVLRAIHAGTPPSEFTDNELCLAHFTEHLAIAESQNEGNLVSVLHDAAVGSRTKTTTTERINEDGAVVEKLVKTEEIPPSERGAQWMLQRRYWERWGREQVEVSGTVNVVAVSVEDRRLALEGKLAQIGERLALEAAPPGPVDDDEWVESMTSDFDAQLGQIQDEVGYD